MTVWPGLGLNIGNDSFASYSSAQVNSDLDYIKAVGINKLRIALPDYGNATAIANMRSLSQAAKNRGFYVSYGVTASLVNSSIWTAYDSAVLSQSAWAQANAIDEFQVGNEFENRRDGTLTELQIRNHMRQLASDVKAAGYTGTVSYSAGQGIGNLSGGWADNPGEGLGGLDYIAVNSYGWWQTNIERFLEFITDLLAAYGTPKVYVSEFNIHHDWAQVTYDPNGVAHELSSRLKAIIATGVPRAYFYTWRLGGNNFAAMRSTGDSHPLWPSLASIRPWFSGIPNVAVQRVVSPVRTTSPIRAPTPSRGEI